ncbi:flippase [Haloferax volcanii]|uniref:Flippase n=1 Tax=Haloferax volcanii TaxID=2246 RepID=A0A558G9J2_HALVO|nr:flippase [Haloferax volcanii]TVT94432.1 flippase [Haloferax volcanii]
MNLVKSGFRLTLARIVKFVLSFLAIVFFANELGASELGVFFLFQALLDILRLPSNLGIRMAIEKRMSEGNIPEKSLTAGVLLKLFLIVIVVPILFTSSEFINDYLGLDLTFLLCLALILQESAGTARSVLRGELKLDQAATLEVVFDVTWVVAAVVLVSFDFGAVGIIYGVILARFLQVLFGILKADTFFSLPSKHEFQSIIGYSKYSSVAQVSGRIQSWMDVLMIGFFLTQAAVGAYEVAWRVTGPILLVGSAVGTTIFPQMSSWQANKDISSIERLFTKSIIPIYVIVIPAIIGGLLLSDEILGIIFGSEFGQASIALVILLIGLIPRAIREITGKTLLGLDLPNLASRVAIIDIFLNVSLNLILIPRMGIVGAAIGTSTALLISTSVQYHYVSRSIEVQLPVAELRWVTISSGIMGAVVYTIMSLVTVADEFTLASTILCGVISYCSILLYNDTVRQNAVEFAKQIGLKSNSDSNI